MIPRYRLPARVLAAAALLTTLAGCIDIAEDVWINADGSGRLRVEFGLSQQFNALSALDSTKSTQGGDELTAQLQRAVEAVHRDSGVTTVTSGDTTIGGNHHLFVDVRVRTATLLSAVHRAIFRDSSDSAKGEQQPKLEVLDHGRGMTVNIVFPTDTTPHDTSQAGEAFLSMVYGEHGFTYRVHGPSILSSNGTLDSTRTTATWSVPLAKARSLDGKTFTAEIDLPPPPAVTGARPSVLLSLAVVVVVAIIFLLMVRRRRTPTA